MSYAENAQKIRDSIVLATSYLDDEQAESVSILFDTWQSGVFYAIGRRVQYNESLYRCVQAHTSQDGWEPPNVPALFTLIPHPGEIPVWKQPTGVQDAYQTGDRVYFPDKGDPVYVSIVDDNVWAPNVYGWLRE